jgi:hypothetical protein
MALYAAEIQRMGSERMESKKHIKSLKPKNDQEFILIKPQLQKLYHALRGPTIDRVFRLSGLNPPINFLLPKSNPRARDHKSREILKKVFWFNRLNSSGMSQTELSSKPTQNSQGDYLQTNGPVPVASQDGSVVFPKGKGLPLENLQIQSTRTAIVDGDEFSYIKDKIINETVDIWNFLQQKLIAFSKAPSDSKKADFQLAFLKSLFQLGDYIFRYGLLPKAFIDNIEIFKPKILSEMVKFHIDLLFLKHGPKFFVAQDSVVPQLEFLTNGLALQHFHKSIKGMLLVYLTNSVLTVPPSCMNTTKTSCFDAFSEPI